MAVHNATFIVLQIASTDLVGETSHSISSSVDVIDISSKATGRTRNILPGRVSENITFETLCDDGSNDYGYLTAHAAMKAGTLVTFKIMRTATAGGAQVNTSDQISGSAYITQLTRDDPDNDRSTMSGTLEIDGDTTVAAYSSS
jgi:hypothetical protein